MTVTDLQIKAQARALANAQMPKNFKPEALHIYKYVDGRPLYAKLRGKDHATGDKWIRPMNWENGSFQMGEPKFQDGKPLYGLDRLADKPAEGIIVCEGEKAVDALLAIGILATTSGGVNSAGVADWTPLTGRKVLIWPDKDEPGLRYGAEVRDQLVDVGCEVHVVDVDKLALSKGGDAVDWLRANPGMLAHDVHALPTLDSAVERLNNASDTTPGTRPAAGANDSFPYNGGYFEIAQDGLSFVRLTKSGEVSTWVSRAIRVEALGRGGDSEDWGRWVSFRDADGIEHTLYIRAEDLVADALDVLRELLKRGLTIANNKSARDLLIAYIVNHPTPERVRTVDQVGWHGSSYVLPSGAVGHTDEQVICRSQVDSKVSSAGTSEQWLDSVSRLAEGNSRMVFAIAAAFAAPLVEPANEESGGFHFRGPTSTGKTTALKVAASVWGSPRNYIRQWRVTVNGLEGIAASHNDGLLVLDELSQADPAQAGEAAYMLSNGRGKTRATRTGEARPAKSWRVLYLSSGEESLCALMTGAGKRTNAGQEIRLADIEVDCGLGLGALEQLHSLTSAAEFIDSLNTACDAHYGAVGIEWLQRIIEHHDRLPAVISDGISQFVQECLPSGGSSQAQRMARRFALVAIAGELATKFGLTAWQEGQSDWAAKRCFRAWLEGFGEHGSREDRNLLGQIRAYFVQYGGSRFQNVTECSDPRMAKRTGFFQESSSGQRQFLVPSESFASELCSGFDSKAAARTLIRRGWLVGKSGRSTQTIRLSDMGQVRTYVFTDKVFEDEI